MNCFLCTLWALNKSIIVNPANSECMRLNTEEEKYLFERHFIHPGHGSFLCPFLPLFIYSVNDKYLSSSSHEAGPVLSSGSTGVINRHSRGSKDRPRSSSYPLIHLLMFISNTKYNGQTAAGKDLTHPWQLGDLGPVAYTL